MRYLLLHGFTGSPASFANLRVPEGSVAPVLGGHLQEPVGGGFWDEVERLAALGQDCAGLLGYSLGGRLALGILSRFPSRFAHAVIIAASAGLETPAERAARRDGDAGFVSVLRQRGVPAFVEVWEKLPLWASQGDLPDSARQAQRSERLRHSAEGLAQSLLQHGLGEMPDLRPQLSEIRSPVDLLVGERDEKFVAHGHELSGLIPNASLTVAPRAGHNLLLERPELCSQLLLQGTEP